MLLAHLFVALLGQGQYSAKYFCYEMPTPQCNNQMLGDRGGNCTQNLLYGVCCPSELLRTQANMQFIWFLQNSGIFELAVAPLTLTAVSLTLTAVSLTLTKGPSASNIMGTHVVVWTARTAVLCCAVPYHAVPFRAVLCCADCNVLR